MMTSWRRKNKKRKMSICVLFAGRINLDYAFWQVLITQMCYNRWRRFRVDIWFSTVVSTRFISNVSSADQRQQKIRFPAHFVKRNPTSCCLSRNKYQISKRSMKFTKESSLLGPHSQRLILVTINSMNNLAFLPFLGPSLLL